MRPNPFFSRKAVLPTWRDTLSIIAVLGSLYALQNPIKRLYTVFPYQEAVLLDLCIGIVVIFVVGFGTLFLVKKLSPANHNE